MVYLISGTSELYNSDLYQRSTVEQCLEYFKDHEWIACDTETQGFDCHSKKILSLQLGDAENQYVIDVRTVNILLFRPLLENTGIILHNAKFDYKFLKAAGIIVEKIYDTMLAECVIFTGYENHSYGLDKLVYRYTENVMSKETRGEFYLVKDQPFSTEQILYAAKDTQYLHEIKAKQEALIDKFDLRYCLNLENEVVKALGDIEYNGMGFNEQAWLENAESFEEELRQKEIELDNLIIETPVLAAKYKNKYVQLGLFGEEPVQVDLNYASPTQMLEVLNTLGLSCTDTSDQTLGKLDSPFVNKLREYRGTAKIVSTYGKTFIKAVNPITKRIHTSFWQIVSTGRVSSGSKKSNSPNLQNIPAANKFRNCFVTRPDYSWIGAD